MLQCNTQTGQVILICLIFFYSDGYIEQRFSFPDFSLSNLLQEMGNVTLDSMKDSAKAVLLQQLGVDQWMLDTPCSITDNLYTPSVNGWNNGERERERERERGDGVVMF